MFIQVKKNAYLQIINAKKLNMNIINPSKIENIYYKAFVNAVPYLIFYFISFIVLNILTTQKINKTKKKLEEYKHELMNESKALRRDKKELLKKSNKLKKDHNKLKIILLSRLRDYSKENHFWRDTIRKYLGKDNKDKATILIKGVTDNLKTFKTNTNDDKTFSTIDLLERELE